MRRHAVRADYLHHLRGRDPHSLLHEQIEETGPFVATSVRFLIEARKPA